MSTPHPTSLKAQREATVHKNCLHRNPVWAALAVSALALLTTTETIGAADETRQRGRAPARELYVPIDELPTLLEAPTRRVLLSPADYADLVKQARVTPEEHAPVNVVLTSADYEITVDERRAQIRGVLGFDVLADGLVGVPLDLAGIGLREARLDDRSAAIGRAACAGSWMLFAQGRGRHRLSLDMVTAIESDAALQKLKFQLPHAVANRWRMTVSGNVEVRRGASVISRAVDEQAGVTRLELVPAPGAVALELTLNNRQKQQQRIVLARSVQVDELTTAYERLHATFSLAVLHRPIDRFRFAVPDGFEVTDVQAAELAHWALTTTPAGKVLEVVLRQEAAGAQVIRLAAVRSPARFDDWSMPRLVPLDVAGDASVVGLLLDDQWKAGDLAAQGLLPLDLATLARVLPASASETEAGAPPLHPVAAYYAPEKNFKLTAHFTQPPSRLLVTSNLLLSISDRGLQARGAFALATDAEKLAALDLRMPRDWHIEAVTIAGRSAAFERYDAGDQGIRIRVHLPTTLSPGAAETLHFEASLTPGTWLGQWKSHPLKLPKFSIAGAAKELGTIAIEAQDDLSIRPDKVTGLIPMDADEKIKSGLADTAAELAWRYEAADYQAALTALRTPARLTARGYSFLRVDPDLLTAHYELIYDVQRAKTRQLALLLPDTTPTEVTIRSLDGVAVKESTSEPAARKGWRRWNALLADGRQGRVRLAVDFQQPRPAAAHTLMLPIVLADDVAYQSGAIALEGNAELDVRVLRHPRAIDVGELVDAEYQPGKRLLGVYGFVGDDGETEVSVTRPGLYGLEGALVERARYETVLSSGGASQTAARFELRTSAPFIEVKLPADATLWSIELDGRPAKPQRKKDRVLVSFPARAGQALSTLRVVYEVPLSGVSLIGRVRVPALQLLLGEAAGAAEVPTADFRWDLYLPAGYRLLRSRGTLSPEVPAHHELAAWQLADVLMEGGASRPLISHSRSGALAPDFGALTHSAHSDSAAAEDKLLGGRTFSGEKGLNAAGLPQGAGQQAAQDNFAAAAAPAAKAKAARGESLAGVRSLPIELVPAGQLVGFESLGVGPRLDVVLVESRRLTAVAWLLGLIVALAGLLLTRQPWRRKLPFVAGVCLLATLIPLVSGWFELAWVFNGAFYAACLLILYYLVAGLARRVARGCCRWESTAAASATTSAAVALVVMLGGADHANLWGAEPAAKSTAPAAEGEDAAPPVTIPRDATVLLYQSLDKRGRPLVKQLLIPYDRYIELWSRGHPEQGARQGKPPVDYALAGAKFSTTLGDDTSLLLNGTLDFDVFVDRPVEIPLPLAGGALASATLDGQPARLNVGQPQPDPIKPEEPALAGAKPHAVYGLQVPGRGRHRLELSLRLAIARSGGWRVAICRLGGLPAAAVSVTVPDPATEVRFNGLPDRASYDTERPEQTIETALAADGVLHIQWRPRIHTAQVDATLKAESSAVLDVQEDGWHLACDVTLEFGHMPRESFSLLLPPDYIVEKVTGLNLRGWQLHTTGDARRLEVTVLRPAVDRQSFGLVLAKRGPVAGHEFDAPAVRVEGAALDSGRLTIRRSTRLDLRTLEAQSATRTDLEGPGAEAEAVSPLEHSPLGLVPFQSYRYASSSFRLRLAAEAIVVRVAADAQTIWRVAERQRSLESRVHLHVESGRLYEVRLLLPRDLQLEQVSADGPIHWETADHNGRRLLTVYFAQGCSGSTWLTLAGQWTAGKDDLLALPRLEVLDVRRQQGAIVVEVDPALQVEPSELKSCQSVLLQRTFGWLLPEQRKLARLAIEYATADYDGKVRVGQRRPVVRASTVTNVRITDRTIEETILLDFTIRDAGVREVAFQLPTEMQGATISVPLLRQQIIEPAGDGRVRVRLQLQDAVMDQLRVLIENDRPWTRGPQRALLPVVETGQTDGRYLMLESSGRGEVVVDSHVGLESLVRGQQQWQALAQLVGRSATQAFRAIPAAAQPALVYQAQDRAIVETAGARIGLAEADLVFDAHGAYRGRQTYRLSNSTEQYLAIDLPPGATLWTAWVAGEPVKPMQPVKPAQPAAGAPQGRVRIPLVKTAAGDLDYAVALTYGGKLADLNAVRSVSFPLMHTVNINVELSQVRLHLPESYRWLNFGGSMRLVAEEGDLQAGTMSYFTRLTQRLAEVMVSSNRFAKTRAVDNLSQLKDSIDDYVKSESSDRSNSSLRQSISENAKVLQEAEKQARQIQEAQLPNINALDNAGALKDQFRSQTNLRSSNVVQSAPQNFNFNGGQSAPRSGMQQQGAAVAGRRAQVQPNAPAAARPAPPPTPSTAIQLPANGDAGAKGEPENEETVHRDRRQLGEQAGKPGPGMGQRAGGNARGAAAVSPPATGLASLDIQLPQRGLVYRFTTPRGDQRVTATAVSAPLITALERVAIVLIFSLLVAAIVRSGMLIAGWRRLESPVGCGFVAFFGFILLASLLLPLAGLVLLVLGAIIAVRLLLRLGKEGPV
jgi:hypothetical protein